RTESRTNSRSATSWWCASRSTRAATRRSRPPDCEDTMESGSRETIQVGALSVRFLVEAADSDGSVSVFECFVPAQSKMPSPHSHDAVEETIYGLEGVTTWTIDGRAIEIARGDAFCVRRGAVHGFDNNG